MELLTFTVVNNRNNKEFYMEFSREFFDQLSSHPELFKDCLDELVIEAVKSFLNISDHDSKIIVTGGATNE